MSERPRHHYPRPQWQRSEWLNLNGEWEFAFDDEDKGLNERWYSGSVSLPGTIQVPFAFQSKLSGIGNNDFHDIVWYRRAIDIPAQYRGKRVLLHFGAVDYRADVWVNGVLVASHEGGHTPFHGDVTDALLDEGNIVVVRAADNSRDLTIPRGKQYWKRESEGCFYTRTTGIWQTVWMEAVPVTYLEKARMTPDIDKRQVEMEIQLEGRTVGSEEAHQLQVEIRFRKKLIRKAVYELHSTHRRITAVVDTEDEFGTWHLWSPEHPDLYDVTITLLREDQIIDVVNSYFGMRKIAVQNGKLCLNNRPYTQKLVLDQGYFPDGNLTPPDDEAIRRDVELVKAMGFNGVRKHQKLEDPRFLYWCDRLGLLVWSEAANAFDYSPDYVRRFTAEWQEAMERDYNHPCIVAWVPINESWGVPDIKVNESQQRHALAMYHLTKSLDSTRPVVSNDGWEMVTTDLYTIHDYEWRGEVLEERYADLKKALAFMPAGRHLNVEGYPYAGQPILVTEFGGIAYRKSDWEGWGYSGAETDEDYEARLRAVIAPLQKSTMVQGYCYTQLTDVEQEINGLLTYDRVPKIPLESIKAINEGR
ncbi:glycoside hydrolase family 2 [Paenibacillus sp. J5C_2022]|uniref:glycoside hydrolase family 2 protein n=1 Tax=Paenibacillus sp. J5C2022 TaxID=2977129 RepID=UPI0021D13EE0|nr:sugar-binding domain-containing protein [Paenibacillus sp. J5C2022]MCU6713073.1 glycoside hydrolase family 2 [Paenibacillus sp. J5C2022]